MSTDTRTFAAPPPISTIKTRRIPSGVSPSKIRIMAFNPVEPPKSYAEAVEEGTTTDQNATPEIDEAAVKESPPRAHVRTTSAQRSLGEVFDEDEGREDPSPPMPSSSPSLRHPRGRLEESGLRKMNGIRPSTPNGNGLFDSSPSHRNLNGTSDIKHEDGADGVLYESIYSKTGESIASLTPSEDYYLSLAQGIKQEASTKSPSPHMQREQRRSELVSGQQMGEHSGIRWAPLNIPLQRRLQTLAMLMHSMSIPGLTALFFLLCSIPLLWPILLPYLIYVLFSRAAVDGTLSHRKEWLRRARMWTLFASYFPARLHRSQELEPTRKYIFGYHPHGIISHGAFAAFATDALGFSKLFPGITNTLLTLDANFRVPIYRDYVLALGLQSVSRESCENILAKGGVDGHGMGRAITIVIGGARESLNTNPRTLRLVLKRRKGFVKMAIRTGADLVPVLAFGENDVYEQLDTNKHPYIHKVQMVIKKVLGFTLPLFHARGVFNYDVGLMPYRRPINIVVGRPIRIMQSATPDPTYVDEMHAQYIDEIVRLWDDWKDTFAPYRTEELELVE